MTKLYSYCKTDVGLKRRNNEDASVVKPDLGFVSVVDGMGGVSFGEVASQIFANTALEVFSDIKSLSKKDTLELVEKAFRLANERILHEATISPSHNGMGCTAELIAFHAQDFVLGHVGDSRTYLFRQGELKRVTRDHSFIQDQIDHGILTVSEAKKHPYRNVILRAVGVNKKLEIDLIRGKSLPGDIFLLCSDGLTDMVEDLVIQKVLSSADKIPDKVEKLINLAKSAGGHDNITVALCELVE
ncbi:MAG: Stp1/IreP family PP2C-type Ser/Thr phosphatase [Planctomycetes bacterium]|nr:Stp1/IreP family PP2C-type Ser/Thr phosphatase [Planctomycetota bacterium]